MQSSFGNYEELQTSYIALRMHLKSTHLGGGAGRENTLHHIFCTISPFNSYFELNTSTASLMLSLIETFKSEINILAAALKNHENLAFGC